MTNKKITAGVIVVLALFTVSVATATRKKVFFQHKSSKALQMDCVEIQGRNEAFAHYNCYDDKGEKQDFKPGTDWKQVKVKEVCFQHQVRDTFKTCLEIVDTESSATEYTCFVNGKPVPLQPSDIWGKFTADDSNCAPHLQFFDVPRTIVFPDSLSGSDSHAPEK